MKTNEFYVKVVFNQKEYTFQNGSEAYIFHLGIMNDFHLKYGMKGLLTYTSLVWDAYTTDDGNTPLRALADYMAKNWSEVQKLSDGKIIKAFYGCLEKEGIK